MSCLPNPEPSSESVDLMTPNNGNICNGMVLRKIQTPGDMYSLPVVMWYMLLSIVSLLQREVPEQYPAQIAGKAGSLVQDDLDLRPESLARTLVAHLLSASPAVFQGCRDQATITLGSLCSGADVAKAGAAFLVKEICKLPGPPVRIDLIDVFACECNHRVWELRPPMLDKPKKFFPDIHQLPLPHVESVDCCLLSPSCKGLSLCNRYRKSLIHADTVDPTCSSGATMYSSLAYVCSRLPRVIVLENVFGMLSPVSKGNAKRNVDIVLDILQEAGYTCGYDLQDAQYWMLPQTRRRVYVWGHRLRQEGKLQSPLSMDALRRSRPSCRVGLSDCLSIHD